MKTREIRVFIDDDQALYNELTSAMMEHRKVDGGYVMQYSEHQENGRMVAVFLLRDGGEWEVWERVTINEHSIGDILHRDTFRLIDYPRW